MFYASIFLNGSGAFRETGALRFLYYPKGALTHHLVVASSISLAPPQAAGLAHSAAPPLPTKQVCFAGTPVAVVVWPAANARSPRGMRLLREPAANVTVLRDCRHWRCVGNAPALISNACENLPPAALSQLWTAPCRPSSFAKRSKTEKRG